MQTQALSIQYIHMLNYTIGYINQSYVHLCLRVIMFFFHTVRPTDKHGSEQYSGQRTADVTKDNAV